MRALLCVLATGLLTTTVHAEEPLPASAPDSLFADVGGPLQVEDRVIDSNAYSTLHEISYRSADGSTVAAYLVVPKGTRALAGVLFGHWGNGTRAEFLPEAELYARAGAVHLRSSGRGPAEGT